MAKITRKYQKQFADLGYTGNLGQFGSYAAGSPVYSDNIDTLTSLSAYGSGLASALVNNAPPALQDINGLFYGLTKQLRYMFQSGIAEWNASVTYYIGSLVHDSAGNVYISLINDNTNQARTIETKWMLLKSSKIRTDTGSVVEVAYNDYIVMCSYVGEVLCIIPDAVSTNKGRVIIIKSLVPTGAGQHVDVQTLNAQNIDGATPNTLSSLYTVRKYVSNGTTWDVI